MREQGFRSEREVNEMDLQTWLRQEWDRVLGVASLLVGAIALYAGYQGMADSAYVAEQLAYLVSGGLGGILFVAVGAVLVIRSYLHDHWRQLDSIEEAIRSAAAEPGPDVGAPETGTDSVASNGHARAVVEVD